VRALSAPRSYWRSSRAHRYSLVFALPLLVFYEILAAMLSYASGGVRNGADVLIKTAFIAVAGRWGPLVFGVVVVGASLWLIRRDIRSNGRDLKPRIFGGMAVESLLMALVFGTVVGTLTARLLSPFAIVNDGPLAGRLSSWCRSARASTKSCSSGWCWYPRWPSSPSGC
jgi:hypothetical protein